MDSSVFHGENRQSGAHQFSFGIWSYKLVAKQNNKCANLKRLPRKGGSVRNSQEIYKNMSSGSIFNELITVNNMPVYEFKSLTSC